MKKVFALLLAAIMCVTLLTGCSAKKAYYVGTMFNDGTLSENILIHQALAEITTNDKIKEYTIAFKTNDGFKDSSIQKEQIDLLAEQKVNAFVIEFVDVNDAAAVLAEAKEGEIPVIVFGNEPSADVMKKYPGTIYVGNGSIEGITEQEAGKIAKAIYDISKNLVNENEPFEGTSYKFDDTGYAVRIPAEKAEKIAEKPAE